MTPQLKALAATAILWSASEALYTLDEKCMLHAAVNTLLVARDLHEGWPCV